MVIRYVSIEKNKSIVCFIWGRPRYGMIKRKSEINDSGSFNYAPLGRISLTMTPWVIY